MEQHPQQKCIGVWKFQYVIITFVFVTQISVEGKPTGVSISIAYVNMCVAAELELTDINSVKHILEYRLADGIGILRGMEKQLKSSIDNVHNQFSDSLKEVKLDHKTRKKQ